MKADIFHGIAAEDRPLDSRQLKVFIRELSPFSGGKLGDNSRKESYTVNDSNGQAVSGNVETTNNIVAEFFGLGSNSAFPPDVVRGEQVWVFKLGDEDKYYWVTAGRDDNLRKTELARWAVSNSESESKNLDESNTYFIELDTKIGKRIRLVTSKSNGEAFGYNITIDATNSFISVGDDQNNCMEIDSNNKRVTLKNNSGSLLNILDQDINILAKGSVVIRGDRNITLSSKGGITVDGATKASGGVSSAGDVEVTGTIKSTGNVIAPNVR
jgi:hypothetical protein